MKKEICNQVIATVSAITDVKKEDIFSNKKQSDIIEARCLIITYCKRLGVSNEYLMNLLNKKSTFSISHMLSQYKVYYNSSKIFKQYTKQLDNKLSEFFS